MAGFTWYYARRLDSGRALLIAVMLSLLGIIVGIGFASVTDIWVSNDVHSLIEAWDQFYPLAISNSISAAVLVPLLGAAYENLVIRPGEREM